MPFIGGLIAVFFHELIYKKVQETIQETEEIDGILDKNDEWKKTICERQHLN